MIEKMNMKKYWKETAVLVVQLLVFYLFPLVAGSIEAMEMVFVIIVSTFLSAIIMGSISKRKTKFLYPFLVSVLFIPSVFIYYNESALVHSVWYLAVSFIGLSVGTLIRLAFSKR